MLLQQVTVSREQPRQQVQQTLGQAAAAKQAAKAARQDHPAEPSVVVRVPDVPVPPGIPTTRVAFDPQNVVPPQAVTISIAFFVMIAAIVIGLPIIRAFARRIDRGTQQASMPKEVTEQLRQLSQSVDAIAIEVERISEGQRFATKMLVDRTSEKQAG